MPRFRPYGLTRAVCGHYLRDSRLCISCVCSEVTAQATMIRFADERAKREYMEKHCFCRGSGGCDQAEMLNKR